MILRDYQSESVDFLAARKRGMVVAPAGSGKTVIGANAVARVAKPGWRVIWIANTQEQVQQAGEAFSHTEGPDIDLQIVCAASRPDTSNADLVVFDEAHHLPAVELWLPAAKSAKGIIWGLSATPFHEDEERNIVVRDVFKEFFTIERSRVLASGHLVHGKVWMHDLDRPGEFDQEIGELTAIETLRRVRAFRNIPAFEHERRAKWQITQEFVQKNEVRNQHIVSMAVQEKDFGSSVLLLVNSIEHGEKLTMQIAADAVMVHSKMGAKKRKAAIDAFRDGTLRVMVATQLADEGLDVPRASCLILAAGGRSAGKLEQRAGRVLRPFAGKEAGVIHDYMDRGATFALAQARARQAVYERLGYEPDIVKHFSSSN